MFGAPSFPPGAPNKRRRLLLPGARPRVIGRRAPVAWYTLQSGKGKFPLAWDSSPFYTNNATHVNAVPVVSGPLGLTRNYNGSSSSSTFIVTTAPGSVPAPYANIAASGTSYSFMAWVKGAAAATTSIGVTAPWSSGNCIFEVRNNDATNMHGWSFGFEGGKLATARSNVNAPSGTTRVSSATSLNDVKWHHVAISIDVNAVSIYIDGKLDATGTFSGTASGDCSVATGTGNVSGQIGCRTTNAGAGASLFNGDLSDVRLYDYALSAAEVRSQFLNPAQDFYQPIDRVYDRLAVASTGINGSLSATIAAITSSSAGTVKVTGSATPTIPAITSSSAGTVLVTGSATPTIPALTSASTGTVLVTGSATPTIAAITSSSAGTVLVTGSATPTFPAITSASTGTVLVTGSLAQTLGNLSLSSTGIVGGVVVTVTGSLTQTLAAITSSSAGKVTVKGALAKTLGAITVNGHAINPALLPPNRNYLQIPRFNIDNPPSDGDTLAHLLLKLREMQQWFDALTDQAVQPTQLAPINPRYGMMRYAIGSWAATLGGVGLYIYKESGWTLIA